MALFVFGHENLMVLKPQKLSGTPRVRSLQKPPFMSNCSILFCSATFFPCVAGVARKPQGQLQQSQEESNNGDGKGRNGLCNFYVSLIYHRLFSPLLMPLHGVAECGKQIP